MNFKYLKYSLSVFVAIAAVLFFISSAGAQGQNGETNTISGASANVNSSPKQLQSFSPSQTFEASEQKRDFPNGALPGFPGFTSYFAQPLTTHEFVQLSKIADVKTEWTSKDVESWAKRNDPCDVEYRVRVVRKLQPTNKFKIVFVKPVKYQFVGIVEVNAIKAGVPMETVFSVVSQEALAVGGNVIVPMNEGARRVIEASGWGVALGYTHVVISGGPQNNAGVGALGIGYAKGQSDYRHEPFARVMVAKVSSEDYAKLQVFPKNNHSKMNMENEKLRKEIQQLKKAVEQYKEQQ